MYSLGMRGSWCEKTFCSPTSHIRIFLLDFCESELPMTWNSMMPRRSSSRAVSSRAALADSRLVCGHGEVTGPAYPLLGEPHSTLARWGSSSVGFGEDHSHPSTRSPYLGAQHGSGVRDGQHDLVHQLHGDVSHDTDSLGILQRQALRQLPLLSWDGSRVAHPVLGGTTDSSSFLAWAHMALPGRGSGVLASRLAAELLLLSFLLKRGVVGTVTVLTAAAKDPWCPMTAGKCLITPWQPSHCHHHCSATP